MTRPALVVLAALVGSCVVAGFVRAADAVKLRAEAPIYSDSKGAKLNTPEAVAFGGGTRLVVGDAGNGRLVAYEIAGDRVNPVGEMTIAELPYPIRIEVTSKGDLLVLGGKSRRIGRVSAAGQFTGFLSVDVSGSFVPRSIELDRSDRLHILDVGGGRILVLDATGKVVRSAPLPLVQPSFFSDLAVDGRGNVYLLDSVGRQVWVLAADATDAVRFGAALGADLDFATSLTVDDAGRLFLADQNGGGVVVLGQDGTFRGRQGTSGFREGMLRAPTDIVSDGGSRLFVADRGNNRVQRYAVLD